MLGEGITSTEGDSAKTLPVSNALKYFWTAFKQFVGKCFFIVMPLRKQTVHLRVCNAMWLSGLNRLTKY